MNPSETRVDKTNWNTLDFITNGNYIEHESAKRLANAAPELLSELEYIADTLEHCHLDATKVAYMIRCARAAIAQAKVSE